MNKKHINNKRISWYIILTLNDNIDKKNTIIINSIITKEYSMMLGIAEVC